MIKYETYLTNVDIVDKYGISEEIIGRNMSCRLKHIKFINRRMEGVEDVDYKSRPLAAAILGVNNTSASSAHSVPIAPERHNTWTDIDEQQLYIDTKPICYLIIAKPGAGAYSLGEALAKEINCIHICPRNVILDEISQQSPTGKTLDFNIRHYKECKINTILSIIIEKLKSPVIKHRGYVLSGIPLVTTNRSRMAYFKKLVSEDTFLYIDDMLLEFVMDLKKKKKKRKPTSGTDVSSELTALPTAEGEGAIEEIEEEEEEVVPEEAEAEEEEDSEVELPSFLLETCKDIIFTHTSYYDSQKVVLLSQINEILKTDLKPDIIIHVTCPDEDLITIKNHKYLDFAKDACVVDPFLSIPKSKAQRWPAKYSMSDYDAPYTSQEVTPFKYHVRPPMNFTDNAIQQLCNYRDIVLPYLERKIKDINPKFIIKVDGRTPVPQMLYNIFKRLHMLPLFKRIIIPEPLYISEPPEEMEEFWIMAAESNVINYNDIKFNRYASPWYARCPVELKKRKSVQGKPKYAVSFFKHVYLLSSLQALIDFWKNPRPYLDYEFLEPTCRFIIMGTKSSGKTMIAECLSWLFDSPILSYESILKKEKQKKFDNFAKSIFSELIATIEDSRHEHWQIAEAERISQLADWHNLALANLKKYVAIFTEIEKVGKKNAAPLLLKKFDHFQEQLSFLPYLNNLTQCQTALSDKSVIEYAPAELSIMGKMPNIPEITDPDVTEAITAYIASNELQQEIEMTPEDISNVIISLVERIDEEAELANSTYGKYIIDGFSPNPEIWDFLSSAKMLPDYTIVLMENREFDEDLLEHYLEVQDTMKNHQERFIQANDPLVIIKRKHKLDNNEEFQEPPASTQMKKIVNDTVRDTIYGMVIENDDKENVMAEEITALAQSVETFRGDWESTKVKLEENYKSFIEVELENKSDIQIVEEVLLKLRQAYCPPCETFENEAEPEEEEEDPKDLLTYNYPRFLGETGIYCPIAYFDYGVMWEGKPDFTIKYGNKIHYFSKEECLEKYRNDYTKYQFFNKPFKKKTAWRICVMGCIGSGKTTISKFIAKELGLIHIDFEEAVNNLLMPRHFKKVGRRYENSFTDVNLDGEAVEAFQMGEEGENLDLLYNENELRRMVYNYFEKGTPMVSVLMQKLLKKLWFEDPYVNIGVIIDGFPKGPQDVEDMVETFCIPDLILELESNSEASLQRLSSEMFKKWKTQQNAEKSKALKKFLKIKQEWMNTITQKIVPLLVIEDILAEVIAVTEVPPPVPSNVSAAVVNSEEPPEPEPQIDADADEPAEPYIVTLYNEIVEQNPEPVDENEWENSEDARERLDGRIESIFEFDDENIQSLKDLLSEQKIKVVSVDASKSSDKVQRKALIKISNLRNRAINFEQTWVVDCVTANLLLSEGYLFLSKFSRMCPVYIYENPDALLNPYKVSKRDGTLFPVVHRCYVYYIHGKESVIKFRTDPLKYIVKKNILSFNVYPLRLAVIGPPKSGKSTMAAKLAKHYGLICISKGNAIRNVLENMHWTILASKINKSLESGDCVDNDLISRAVQTALFDYRTLIHGFVLDGFPENPSDAMELDNDGIYPLVIFDLSTNRDKLIENSQNEIYYDVIKYLPPYPEPYIQYRFSRWSDIAYAIRNFIKGDCQNLITFDGNETKWQCYQNAKDYISSITPKIHNYITNINSDLVLPVDVMCITNDTFKKNMSSFETFCPVCLKNKTLRHSGEPVDKKGVVQYEKIYYWICSEHMDMVMNDPETHLRSCLVTIPKIPVVVKTVNPILVYENGICIVTYAEHLPSQIIKTGSYKYAANYNRKIYLFCNEQCLRKFMEKPHMYYDITVFKGTKCFPEICLKKLPNIGYLEQTVGVVLTRACCAVNVVRPKYPGLNVDVSGLLYIALYLKLCNPLIEKAAYPLYKKTFDVYEARAKYIIRLGLRLRSMDNPFSSYPKCCNPKQASKRLSKVSQSSTVCKPSAASFNAFPNTRQDDD